MNYFGKKEAKVSAKKRESLDEINNEIAETFENYEHLKGNAYYNWVEKRVFDRSKRYSKSKYLFDKTLIEEFTVTNSVFEGYRILTIAFGAYLVIKGISTVGTIIAFLRYAMGIIQTFRFFVRMNAYMSSLTVHFERIEKFFELPDEKNGTKEIEKIEELKGNINYNIGEKIILRNAKFEFKKGKIYGIWGESGVGKSTLLRILTLIFNDYEGFYMINNAEGKEINLLRLRNKIGYINQEAKIFHGTVMENIKVDRNISEEKVKEICKKLGIHEMIEKLPDKYNTLLGKEGVELSGGQKQMILLARAIMKEPEVILLDEATASIDEENERKIMKMLKSIKDDKIILVISHRRSTLQACDEVIEVKNNEFVKKI